MQRYLVLDSIRGLSALCVALFHFHTSSFLSGLPVVRNGYLFVDVFFVLSGFLMCMKYADAIGSLRDLRSYVTVRFWRIYPLHLATTAVIALMVWPGHSGDPLMLVTESYAYNLQSLATHLTLTHALHVIDYSSWNWPSWSISAEFFTYVVFAGAVLTFGRLGVPVVYLAGAIAFALLAAMSETFIDVSFDFGFLRAMTGFAVGCGVWRLRARMTGENRFLERHPHMAEVAVTAAFVVFVSVGGGNALSYAAPAAGAALVYVFSFERGVVSRLLRGGVPVFLGAISYSIYLNHLIVENAMRAFLGTVGGIAYDEASHVLGNGEVDGALALLVTMAVLVGVSWFTWRTVEMPCYRWGKRNARRARADALEPLQS